MTLLSNSGIKAIVSRMNTLCPSPPLTLTVSGLTLKPDQLMRNTTFPSGSAECK